MKLVHGSLRALLYELKERKVEAVQPPMSEGRP
jgi:hypothetical protein